MKNYYYYTISTLVALLISISVFAVDTNAERLTKLQPLIDYDLDFDTEVTTNHIIEWEKQLVPELEQQGQLALMFQLQMMSIQSLIIEGNISLAINNANLMYQKAKELDCPLGIALAVRAMGKTYLNTATPQESVAAYYEAFKMLLKLPHAQDYALSTLARLIIIKIQTKQLSDIPNDLKLLSSMCLKSSKPSCEFFLSYCHSYYYITINDLPKAYKYLKRADAYCKIHPYSYYTIIVRYLYSSYHIQSKEYTLALKEYDELLKKAKYSSLYRYVQMLLTRAEIFVLMGKDSEACHIYDSINMCRDSLDAQSYVRQITELHTLYKIDQSERNSLERQKKILYWSTFLILIILILIIFFIYRIKRENKRLLRSQLEQEEAKIQAEKSIRTKSLFLSNMSHEIRTPLNALSGFSTILTEESIDNETRKQCNDIIQQNSELLLKLINDVIDLSSLEIGKMAFKFGNYEVVGLCGSVVEMVEKIKQTNATVLFDTSIDSLELHTDDARLQQVLINLLINATKFTTQGTITLRLEKQDETEAIFSVFDTGCGIPKEKQHNLFKRFEKLDENAQGTGLGLSICQFIIEQFGGKIWIDPEYTNGCCFKFTHPIHKKEEGAK